MSKAPGMGPDRAIQRVLDALAERRLDEAERLAHDRARRHPNAESETLLALVLRESGRADEALALLQRATARQPPYPPAFHDLGLLHYTRMQYDAAAAILLQGLDAAPNSHELLIALGNVLLERGDREGARTYFARALAQAPDHPAATHGMGTALLHAGEYAAAAARFRRVLAEHPDNVQSLLNLGICLVELGDWDAALVPLRKAVRLAPDMYGKAVKAIIGTGRGRFWLKPTAIAALLKPEQR
jgi:tetratricopeptide (TPR) repeat protein